MESIAALALSLIAALLFYRFVERQHKLQLGKALAVCVLFGAALTGIMVWRDHKKASLVEAEKAAQDSAEIARARRDIAALTVTYLPESTHRFTRRKVTYGLERERSSLDTLTKIRFRVCNVAADTIDAIKLNARTWQRGHSSHAPLFYDDKPVTSDLVLAPQSCAITQFVVWHEVLDSVEAWALPTWRVR